MILETRDSEQFALFQALIGVWPSLSTYADFPVRLIRTVGIFEIVEKPRF